MSEFENKVNDLLTKSTKRLRILRELHNYTQEYVADCIGVTQSYYSRIETYNGHLSIDIIKKVLFVYKIDLETFINFDLSEIIKSKKLNI